MDTANTVNPSSVLNRYTLAVAFVWTMIMGGSLAWNLFQNEAQTQALIHKEAVANFDKDQGFWLWGTKHGGVYVPITEDTQPSPYMSHIPERDIATPSGKQLTLLNPASMVRQLMEDYTELYGIRGRITGKVVLHPGNAPDEWEKKALDILEAGAPEYMEDTETDGQPYHRMMRPMYMKPGCEKCHGHMGFKAGDFRGGVSVAVPIAPYLRPQNSTILALAGSHALIWFLGLGLISLGSGQIRDRIDEAQKAEAEVRTLNAELENRVGERTEQLKTALGERERAERALRVAKDQAEKANLAKS